MSRFKIKSPEPGRTQRGFTLLEVIVALIIAGLGLTLLLGAVSQGLGNAQTADRYLEATRRAQAHLAEIGVTSPLTPGVATGDDGGGFAWRTEISQPLLQQPGPGKKDAKLLALYTVQATVSWQADGQMRDVSLQSKRVTRP